MTIIPMSSFDLSPRDELVHEIMLVLDEAITSDDPVSVHDLADQIVSTVEEHHNPLMVVTSRHLEIDRLRASGLTEAEIMHVVGQKPRFRVPAAKLTA